MTYVPTNEVACYLVVPPQFADQVFSPMDSVSGGNLRCLLKVQAIPHSAINEFQDGTSEQIPFGDDTYRPEISFNSASTDSIMALEYIRKNNIPVCVYPRVEGSVQFSMPLMRGIGTDPLDITVTDDFELAAGTTMYLPRPVASVGERMFPVVDDMPLAPGIMTGHGTMTRFPTGAGYAMFKPQTNLLKASHLGGIIFAAPWPGDGWGTELGVAPTPDEDAGIIDSPWCEGEYAYWTTNTGIILSSYKFDMLGSVKEFNISCYLRTDGIVKLSIHNSAGAELDSQNVRFSDGRVQLTYDALAASPVDCTIRVQMVSGTKMMFGCPQLINGGVYSVDEYYPYLGTATAVQGELVASRLLISDCDWAVSNMRSPSDYRNYNAVLAVSGYWQSGFSDIMTGQHCTLAFLNLYHTTSQGDIELRFRYTGADLEFALYSLGARKGGVFVTDHTVGDVYAFVLYSGIAGGVGATVSGMKVVNFTKGIVFDTFTDSAPGTPYATKLFPGMRSTAGYQANGLIGAFAISSCSATDAPKIAERLGDRGIADLFRRTIGRWYHLGPGNVEPHQFTRETWRGSYPLTQMREI